MKFNIVDGNRDYLDQLPAFVKLYNDVDIMAGDIPELLGLTLREYRNLRKEALERGLINLRKAEYRKKISYGKNPKHYHRHFTNGNCYFRVQRIISGKLFYGGIFKKESHAKKMVELLEDCDWDCSRKDELRERVLNE